MDEGVRDTLARLVGRQIHGLLQGGGEFGGRLLAVDGALNLLLADARVSQRCAPACLLRGSRVLLFGLAAD